MIPVYVITGFLGSGKTTLLNHLVNQPGMKDTALIINEFGDVGIDHLLVDSAFEDTVLMQSGCICCTIRGDLIDTLSDLLTRSGRGEIPSFSRVVIETTGLADPAPVLQTLMSDPNIADHYRLGGVVTTVDAVNGSRQLDEHEEPAKQAAVADRIVLTKTDLATSAEAAALNGKIRTLNPASPIFSVINGKIGPEKLFDTDLYDPKTKNPDVDHWLRDGAFGHGSHHHGSHHHDNDVNRHGAHIQAFCLTYEKPLPWAALKTWLDSVISLRGSDVLRIKGIVNVMDSDGPVIIHGVQHIFHAPVLLKSWPDEDTRSRIVFITRGLEQQDLEAALEAVLNADCAAAA